jgi:hypothetical protein
LSGKIKKLIDQIIEERSNGNPAIAEMTIAKLILKGLNPNKFDSCSADNPEIISKLLDIAKQLNVLNLTDEDINIKSAFSTKSLEDDVVLDIESQLNCCNPMLLVFFAAPSFDQQKLSSLLQKTFKNCVVVGCSTAGEIVSGNLLKDSVVAMSINSNIISDAKVEVISHKNEKESLYSAFTSFEEYFNQSAYTMDTTKYVGLILIDGVSMKEERIMDLIGNRTNVFFVGGSAGDNLKFVKTHVCANGEAYTDSSVLVLLRINDNAEFGIIKTQSYKALDKVLTANKVNEQTREVIEFNNKPAITAYAEAVGAPSTDNISNYLMSHPVGLLIGENDIFIRSPQQLKGSAMIFYCNLLEGMEVTLLESTNIIEDTKKAVEDKIKDFGRIDGLINFQCIERTLQLEKKNLKKQYSEIFKGIPTIGFSTYGEQFIGHMNRTATMLVFRLKSKL